MAGPVSPRMTSPAALRNREVIADVLARVLPPAPALAPAPAEPLAPAEPPAAALPVLEIASGTGEHVVHFARRFDALTWQPSDPRPEARASVDALVAAAGLENVRPAVRLDVLEAEWPVARAAAIVCINMIHASPRETIAALMVGAARVLASGAPLVLYGAYRVGGAHTAPSNETFDGWLKERDPRWGVRDVEDVEDAARLAGFVSEGRVAMPANNLVLVLRRATLPA